MLFRQRGHRAIAQRLTALASRLAVEPIADDGKVESALSYLEEVTGAAHNAVSDSNAESVRLRRSLDTLPLGLVLCDETGGVIFRNVQAEISWPVVTVTPLPPRPSRRSCRGMGQRRG